MAGEGVPPANGLHAQPALVWSALGVVYVVWGSTYLAIRVAIETIPPMLGASFRFLVAGSILYSSQTCITCRASVASARTSFNNGDNGAWPCAM